MEPEKPWTRRVSGLTVRDAALAAAGIAAAVGAWFCAPDATWLDGSELQAGAFQLGVAHPPGHPLPLLVAHLVGRLLPLGSFAFRATLASVLATAALAGLFVLLAQGLYRSLAERALDFDAPTWVLAAAVSLATALLVTSRAATDQALRTEVYALEASAATAAAYLAWLAWHRGSSGPLLGSGLALGLALSNHHVQAAALAVPLSLAVLVHPPGRRVRAAVLFGAGTILGLAVWLALPVRAGREALVNWGHPDTLDRFLWVISTRLYYKTARRAALQPMLRWALLLYGLGRDLGPGAFLGIVGLYVMARSRPSRGLALLAGLVAAVSATGAFLAGYDPHNPDSGAYLLAAMGALSLAAGFGLLTVVSVRRAGTRTPSPSTKPSQSNRKGRLQAAVAWILALGLLAPNLGAARRIARPRDNWSASDTAFSLAARLPPDSVFLGGYHETVFLLWEAATVEGLRPDTCLTYRYGLSLPGRWPQMRRSCPVLGRLFVGGRLSVTRLERTKRPVVLEPADLPADPVDRAALGRFLPWGCFALPQRDLAALGGRAVLDGRTLKRLDDRFWAGLNEVLAPFGDRPGPRRFLLWHTYQAALLWAFLGRCEMARQPWQRAWRLAPADPELRRLADRCRFPMPM